MTSLVRRFTFIYVDVKVDLAEMDITSAESKATYRQIKAWVKENYGIKTRNEYIARVKEKYGIIEDENSRPSQNPDYVRRDCPDEHWKPIEEALKFF
ncbi:23S rRNA (uracil1939-C5)-methyltransferase [Pseudobutyrivibrio ruminis]|uniref:23S rRNA (Uracil1939-C5)-methyltransferase n=1 Tax=Pseudobutyrivibrio ruminis TaxID=46206 RepID=A0A1H7M2V5_9FIRM|nr:23S rRNA (uracil1939-C5)-methyltransferase [Pseudobutyrivibrio ruminis]